MRNETRILLNQYLENQARLNGISDASVKFAVEPTVQQRLEARIQESSAFLKSINIVPVDEMMGETLGIGVDGPIASRTDTSGAGRRQTRDVSAMNDQKYLCAQTNYDTHVRYPKLDMWAKFGNKFQLLLSQAIQQRCALDRIMIGFNGTSVAVTTNRAANPLLQDVNKGWLQYVRENAAQRVLDGSSGTNAAGKVVVGTGAGADYANLDGLVYDVANTLLETWHVGAGDLVAIVGRGLMHDKLFPLVNDQNAPTEILAASIVRSQKRLGELQAITVPFMPEGKIAITSLSNLSIYWQQGGRRRHVKEAPEADRIETYESSNDAFVVEDLGKFALIENIELQD
ncbi:phage major capsid protein, P2 family [Diaphorobacter sp. HDW4A]|uniref:phage major capsid protein, P2 family n=1 Tax=Diaphorobacter sp. HDW4A TaxID=2714924 RepID=UPI00140E4A25|nr:phage major capsid protein, P2 family [Diaphorobacter sp. HDW4A]QIL80830.1 phage major capsid protein, P2 family [Diaphorobacter sp. HDW4A]QIL83574.1 phage major capsid protein, P2 family [Diaphorobacter sp. HDW4A]